MANFLCNRLRFHGTKKILGIAFLAIPSTYIRLNGMSDERENAGHAVGNVTQACVNTACKS